MASKTLQQEFPLHWLAWHNNYEELDRVLKKKQVSQTGTENQFVILYLVPQLSAMLARIHCWCTSLF